MTDLVVHDTLQALVVIQVYTLPKQYQHAFKQAMRFDRLTRWKTASSIVSNIADVCVTRRAETALRAPYPNNGSFGSVGVAGFRGLAKYPLRLGKKLEIKICYCSSKRSAEQTRPWDGS